MSYSANYVDLFRQIGVQYVGRILKGTRPADLPVQRSSKFELGDQSQDRQGARSRSSSDAARPRRRGADSGFSRQFGVVARLDMLEDEPGAFLRTDNRYVQSHLVGMVDLQNIASPRRSGGCLRVHALEF